MNIGHRIYKNYFFSWGTLFLTNSKVGLNIKNILANGKIIHEFLKKFSISLSLKLILFLFALTLRSGVKEVQQEPTLKISEIFILCTRCFFAHSHTARMPSLFLVLFYRTRKTIVKICSNGSPFSL